MAGSALEYEQGKKKFKTYQGLLAPAEINPYIFVIPFPSRHPIQGTTVDSNLNLIHYDPNPNAIKNGSLGFDLITTIDCNYPWK